MERGVYQNTRMRDKKELKGTRNDREAKPGGNEKRRETGRETFNLVTKPSFQNIRNKKGKGRM